MPTSRKAWSRSAGGRMPGLLLILTVASAALASPLRGQELRPLTLDEALAMGLERSDRLRTARAEAGAAEAVRAQVDGTRMPALRAAASYTRLSDNIPGVEFTVPGTDSTVTFQGVELNRFSSELSVEVPLLSQLRLRHEVRSAGHEAAAADLAVEQELADLAFDIRRAWWTLHGAVAVLETIDAALERVEADVATVQARLDAGAALPRDVLAARTRRSEVRLEQVDARNAVRVARLELNRLIGLPLDTSTGTTPRLTVEPATPGTDAMALPSPEAVSERPAIGALAERVEAYREQVRAAEAARIPELGFIGRYVYSRPNPYFFSEQDAFRGTWELGFSASWGIWQGGRLAARTAEARARMEAAEARLRTAREEVTVEVARRRLEVERAAQATAVAAEIVEEARESYRVVREQLGEGAARVGDVLDAEDALRRAEARAARAATDQAIAGAAVLQALGRVR